MSSETRGGKSSGKKTGTPGKKTRSARKKTSLPSFAFDNDLLKNAGTAASAGEPETSPAIPEPVTTESPPPAAPAPPKAGKKVTLPAFGFAEDLLKDVERQRARSDVQEGGVQEGGVQEASRWAGEDRVFAFADELDAVTEEEKVVPVRLETWLTFGLAGETYALPVAPVHEVVRPSSITRVPHAPRPIRGVTNLRGRVVPVIDLRLRLELTEAEVTRGSRVLVVGSRGRRIGLLVDLVHHVIHLDMDRVQAPPDDVMTVQSDYISGVYHLEEDLILLLDVDRVLIVKDDPPAVAPPATVSAVRQGAL